MIRRLRENPKQRIAADVDALKLASSQWNLRYKVGGLGDLHNDRKLWFNAMQCISTSSPIFSGIDIMTDSSSSISCYMVCFIILIFLWQL